MPERASKRNDAAPTYEATARGIAHSDCFTVTCGRLGDYIVVDPAAPLVHGCRVVVRVAAGRWYTEATLHTKRAAKAKTLAVVMEGGRVERGFERHRVARVVGHFQALD